MPVKLFAVTDETESKQAMGLLEEADIDYELIEPEATLMGYQVMFAVTGTRRTPVLCVDGKAYRGMKVSNHFLQPGECFIDLPDSECGAFNDRVNYSPPNYVCSDCGYILGTETDIEADTDSDYQPGERDGTDGEGEDDEARDETAPVNPLDVDDTPEETWREIPKNNCAE